MHMNIYIKNTINKIISYLKNITNKFINLFIQSFLSILSLIHNLAPSKQVLDSSLTSYDRYPYRYPQSYNSYYWDSYPYGFRYMIDYSCCNSMANTC